VLSAGEECAPYGTKVRRARANKKGGIFELGPDFQIECNAGAGVGGGSPFLCLVCVVNVILSLRFVWVGGRKVVSGRLRACVGVM